MGITSVKGNQNIQLLDFSQSWLITMSSKIRLCGLHFPHNDELIEVQCRSESLQDLTAEEETLRTLCATIERLLNENGIALSSCSLELLASSSFQRVSLLFWTRLVRALH